jgi:sulfate permease, SulP family
MANSDVGSLTHRFLPILDWAPGYRRDWLLPDVLAGLALWAVMVPEGMAYAGIVGVPPIMGLYTIVPALVAYALLGTSRQLVVGPDTATGLISAVTIGAIASQGTAEFSSLTSTLAVLIGFFFCFGIMRMGWVASFIPTPVMRGFIEGLVYVTIIGQVPHLLGISGTSGNFFTKLWHILQYLPDVSAVPVVTGILSLAAMLLLRHLAPAVPAALVVMATATIVIGLLGGEATGVHVAGHLPSGLPHLTRPNLDISTLSELVPGALGIVLVGYAEALGAAKAAALQSGGTIDPNQELVVAHGPANILSGLFGGFLVVGSLSKTSVATAAGARSQIANLVAAVFSFFTLIFLTPLFRNMPQPALAAIVIAAMLHLTKPSYLLHLLARSPGRLPTLSL